MCYHKYTHFKGCATHIPMHTHTCPKNFNEDATRVIFCEDYRTVQLRLPEPCPFCPPRSPAATLGIEGTKQPPYPTPPKTVTP